MARRCDLCNKRALTGNSVSHSNRKTKKRQMPNLHFIRKERLKLCTKCYRRWLTVSA